MTDNYYQRKYVVVVADVSTSMAGAKIDICNQFIRDLYAFYQADEYLSEIIDMSIIASDAEKAIDIAPTHSVQQIVPPVLQVQETTADVFMGISLAQELIEERKDYYKSHAIAYHRPLIILLTDGDITFPAEKIYEDRFYYSLMEEMITKKRYMLLTIGVGDMEEKLMDAVKSRFPLIKTMEEVYAEFQTIFSESSPSWMYGAIKEIEKNYIPEPQPEIPIDSWLTSFDFLTEDTRVSNSECNVYIDENGKVTFEI